MPKKLMLHIGHPKTGSSYLQSVLALNKGMLSELGFNYFDHASTVGAAHGEITSGNGAVFKLLLDDEGLASHAEGHSHVFSSENLFFGFINPEFQQKFVALSKSGIYEEIFVLLYIRDLVSWSASAFQQYLKHGKEESPEIEHMFDKVVLPIQVNNCLDFLASIPIAKITVLNYSIVRPKLVDTLADWFHIDAGKFEIPARKIVNRSMTASELMLLSELKKFPGEANNIVSTAFCHDLPDVEPDVIMPSLESQNALWDRLATEIERANTRIEPSQRYDRKRDIQPPKNFGEVAEFSRAQVGVIASCIATLNQRLQNNHRHSQDLTTKLAETRERNQTLLAQIEDLRARIVKLRPPTP